jgi:hypothetical protein
MNGGGNLAKKKKRSRRAFGNTAGSMNGKRISTGINLLHVPTYRPTTYQLIKKRCEACERFIGMNGQCGCN